MSGAAAAQDAAAELERRRLVWRCRRGMKELDVLLERYAHVACASAGAAERRAFTRLLECTDPQLADYLFGHQIPADPELASLARRIGCGAFATGEGN